MNEQAKSPSSSYHEASPLDRLVTHFVAAKRSLSSIALLYRANDIVKDARSHIEEVAVLRAKNTFVKDGAKQEIHVLYSVKDALDGISKEAQVDFQVGPNTSTLVHGMV